MESFHIIFNVSFKRIQLHDLLYVCIKYSDLAVQSGSICVDTND